ncbi:MAG: NAD(P)/FAD-dependent oxidoreductase [Deltaproteobacteria bacterium]|nr:NAD(P)/FAD-dependent oxidoreductase [Deltaproteobacteria bacterium]
MQSETQSAAPVSLLPAAHYRIVVVGGGTAGITIAARLAHKVPPSEIAIIEPSDKHYYQPLWTLVGGGVFPKQQSEHDERALIPPGTTWLRDAVTEFSPDTNTILTREGKRVHYDSLIVAPGLQLDWDKVKGLKESLGRDGVCSNYSYDTVDKTWEFIRACRSGNAIFTQPSPPIKCAGAPQKIMYLADDTFRKNGVRQQTNVIFTSAAAAIFAVKKYAQALDTIVARRQIDARFQHNLVEVRSASKEAVFQRLDTKEEVVLPYNLLHVTPPMSAPDFIKRSPLANETGWVDVDKQTLQHVRYPNIFSLGDASSLPTSKTGAAIRKQAPILVQNLLAARQGKSLTARYDGYTSCPLVTGYGKLILAEFDYDLKPQETFPFDQGQERYSMYLLKAYGLPALYWHGMVKGRA